MKTKYGTRKQRQKFLKIIMRQDPALLQEFSAWCDSPEALDIFDPDWRRQRERQYARWKREEKVYTKRPVNVWFANWSHPCYSLTDRQKTAIHKLRSEYGTQYIRTMGERYFYWRVRFPNYKSESLWDTCSAFNLLSLEEQP